MDPITLATLLGIVIAVLGFLYLVFIGQHNNELGEGTNWLKGEIRREASLNSLQCFRCQHNNELGEGTNG